MDDKSDSPEGDLEGGFESKRGGILQGGGEGEGAPTAGLRRSPRPCK